MVPAAMGITSLWRQPHKEAADAPLRDHGSRVLCLLPREVFLNKGAAALGLSWGGGREAESEVSHWGVSGCVQYRGVSPWNTGCQRGDLNFPGEVFTMSEFLIVSWVTLCV